MSIKKTIIKKVEEVEHTTSEYTCDICGKTSEEGWGRGSSDQERDEVTIIHEVGTMWNSADYNLRRFEPDICPECFTTKIIPFLKELGVPIEMKEVS